MYFDQFKNSEAKESFDQALAVSSIRTDSLYYRGRTLVRLKRLVEAMNDFNRLRDLDPSDIRGLAGRAEIFIKEINWNAATREIANAMELNPRDARLWYLRGLLLGYQGQIDLSIEVLRRCLEIDPTHAYAHYELGLAYNQKRKKDLAILQLQKFLELAPNAPEAEQVRKLLSTLQKIEGERHLRLWHLSALRDIMGIEIQY